MFDSVNQAEIAIQSIEKILLSNSLCDAWESLRRPLESFGLNRIIYCQTSAQSGQSTTGEAECLIFTNHDKDYSDFFIDSFRYQYSPFFIWSVRNTGFISWEVLTSYKLPSSMEKAAKKISKRFSEFDIRAGYAVSFPNTTQGRKSAASICGKPKVTQSELDDIWEKNRLLIETLLLAFDSKVATLPHPENKISLTKRQKQVLSWVAQGKTNQDISDIMNISISTVEKYLSAAREAMNATTTTQAATKLALLNNLIFE